MTAQLTILSLCCISEFFPFYDIQSCSDIHIHLYACKSMHVFDFCVRVNMWTRYLSSWLYSTLRTAKSHCSAELGGVFVHLRVLV